MSDIIDTLRARLAPSYDVEREIGAGGMARVFLAVEQHPHRRVAIKVLDPEVSTRLLRERFIREVDLSSKLSHPHIVPIFSAGEVDGLFYYVMPYVEGESLRHRLMRERKLPLEAALHITRDVADALAFAHAQGIIHRDIKPENILLPGDHAIVADFGIARAISAAGALTITQTGQSIGSPGYMSPEQALGSGDLDARTDIYSLGCVLFEMLAGEPPVPSLAERLIHNWEALESCDALRRVEGGVVRAVKHAISKALAPLPDDRFATAAEFAAALGGSAHRTSVPTRGIFAGRRGRRIALVGAALAVAGAAAGAFVLLRRPASGLTDRRVVVAVIENHTGDPAFDNLGHMAADWVTQGLAQTGLVEVVPSMSVMMAAGEHGPGHLDAAGLRALGRETGAGTVVWGAYYRQGDSVRFQIQISAAADGTVLRALDPVAGPLAQPLSAVEALRQRVMAALATLFDSRLSRWATNASQPPNFQAYQEFIAGLDRFVQFDMRGAIAHFERAAAVDTTFRLPLIFAANAHMNVGEFAAADSIGHALERHAARFAPLDRAYLAWVLATCRGDGAEALRAARAMVSLAPASEALYLVAEDAMALNRPREAADARPRRGGGHDAGPGSRLAGGPSARGGGIRGAPVSRGARRLHGGPARRRAARIRAPGGARGSRPERLAGGRRRDGRRVGPDGLPRVPGRHRGAPGEPRPGAARRPGARAREAAVSIRPAHGVAGAGSGVARRAGRCRGPAPPCVSPGVAARPRAAHRSRGRFAARLPAAPGAAQAEAVGLRQRGSFSDSQCYAGSKCVLCCGACSPTPRRTLVLRRNASCVAADCSRR